MIIILDVNILLSALIKDSLIRKVILTINQEFCFPEPSLQKIKKYKSLILEKSDLSEEDFQTLLEYLFQFIRVISTEEILTYWSEAKKLLGILI